MALSIVLDNDAERLADALAISLDDALADPFTEDVVVVPSLGVGRWLQQRLARRDGVCARVSIEFPGRFLWRLLERAVPGLP
ncbi:MAG: exodeoxyribonuclease V subunit gamma, partial [Burkholderiaceae bacterium]|nr:exodeoxyribonuclease V subunit gamma [Burkholderiaceae bacterium]